MVAPSRDGPRAHRYNPAVRTAALLFAFGLALRLLFVLGGPDGGPGWHVGMQGDVPIWQDQARRLAAGEPDAELLLPWRAPGTMWLVSALWDGGPSVWPVRLAFLLAGASIAPLLWLLLRRCVEPRTAVVAASLCAASGNLLLLSSGLHVGVLYLSLSLATLVVQRRLEDPHRLAWPIGWGALHGLLCLLRTENVLGFPLLLLLARWNGVRWRSLGAAVATAALLVTPWQVHAAQLVARWNDSPAVPARLSLPWQPQARDAAAAVPGFARRFVMEFVDATVQQRGGRVVTAEDLQLVRDAFGSWPEPLPVPIVSLNGPYNFFLANSREARGGFSRAAYDRDPPLAGGAAAWPAWLRLAPGRIRRFDLGWPPHLDITLHGYALGLRELAAEPAALPGLLGTKLWYGLAGATGGLGGYALPIGLSGERRAVDFVVADGAFAAGFRVVVLGVALFGLWRVRGRRGLWPLFLWQLLSLGVLVAFFGLARHGVQCLPAVALGVAAVVSPWLARAPRLASARAAWLAMGVLLAIEGVRAATVTATVDGQPAAAGEPFPGNEYVDRRVEFR